MSSDYRDILRQYWGYDDFRPLQLEIIRSISSGKDTLGLMPTGGGKSLTFQVPTMAMEGVCLVITPLIALMKDQIENLRKRNIAASAVHSGLSREEVLRTLENCVLEAYKFLYVSPERLITSIFLEKVKQMKICMIAVDESHCISQWGYDFRPSYLQIANIRELFPEVPILALTATATLEVVKDIQDKLAFRKTNVFRKSFYRSNLAYVVRNAENKEEYLLKILQRVEGSSIVYVRNRKKTKDLSDFLCKHGVSSEYFHAGLPEAKKSERQKRWTIGETRVIVSTNAFGMGIDKPNVRTVIHMDLPDSIEAYFQEAGRAGRDEKKAYAILLYNASDASKIKKRISDSFPQKDFIRSVYDALGNYFQIGLGSGLDSTFPFDIGHFCSRFKLPAIMTLSALKILQQAGYIELTGVQENTSSLLFRVNKEDLYTTKYSQDQDKLIHLLLRSYTGLFTEASYISEEVLAQRLQWTREKVYNELLALSKVKIIQYIPRKQSPLLIFTQEREDKDRLVLSKDTYEKRRESYTGRIQSMLEYAQETHNCRSKMLLAYFGETEAKSCGQCDICLRKREELSEAEFSNIRQAIRETLNSQSLSIKQLTEELPFKEKKTLQVIRFMLDHNELSKSESMLLKIK